MRAHQVVSGGERVGKSPAGRPAPRFTDLRAEGVIRRSGRCLAEFYRAVDWAYLRFTLAVAATVFVLVYVARMRGR